MLERDLAPERVTEHRGDPCAALRRAHVCREVADCSRREVHGARAVRQRLPRRVPPLAMFRVAEGVAVPDVVDEREPPRGSAPRQLCGQRACERSPVPAAAHQPVQHQRHGSIAVVITRRFNPFVRERSFIG